MKWKMLFKFGITVIVLIAIYLYFALKSEDGGLNISESDTGVDSQIENEVSVKDKGDNDVNKNSKQALKTENGRSETENIRKTKRWLDAVHLSVVACGDRGEESIVMFKSAVLLSRKPLVFHIFADLPLQSYFKRQLDFWPDEFRNKIVYYHIYNITFPSENTEEWKKLFKPCASQRLFIPSILTDVNSLIYVDTDMLFLRPLEDLWSFFSLFNSTQLAALAPEHEDTATGWYNRFARHPYYGLLGVNSGVMLMNLTRLRSSEWLQSMLAYYKEYRYKITWGDQDLINIYFHYHPDELYVYNCDWNYRPDHCMYMSVCKEAEKNGVSVLHGCRRVWHNDKQPAFKAIYTAFKEHRLGDDLEYSLLKNMDHNLVKAVNTPCGKLKKILLKKISSVIKEVS
ncbi:hypothetical protein KUTeg_023125 [Tegillarca granosa]|uniref:UDP-D-xylose:beta-D-glucoside alpha-1,3-D-xylosyltransferase n=1 Tax=Tegillarca granosa TaxID=220873 RepID=A0ABQ9E6I4_TEGGR|nr:hypothetical protein KUTeg_023125 [Tegillarca granosa]